MGRILCAALLSVAAVVHFAGGPAVGTARSVVVTGEPLPCASGPGRDDAPESTRRSTPMSELPQGDVPTEEEPLPETLWLGEKRVSVIDAASRAPVEGARASVLLFDGCELRESRDATTDVRGEALLAKGFGTSVALLVRRRGYAANFRWLKHGNLPEAVELAPGMPVRASVTLVDGRPAAGARVYAWDAETHEEIVHDAGRVDACGDGWIATDRDGAFEIDGVVPGRPFLLAIRLPGYGVYRAVHEAEPELAIRLGDGAVLEGAVYDAGGTLQPGAEVFVEPEGDGCHYSFGIVSSYGANACTVADDQGRFRIVGIAPGRYVVTASMGYWARGASEAVEFRGDGHAWRDVAVEKCASLKVRFEEPPESRWLRWDLRHLDGSSSWSRLWSNSWTEGESYSRDGIHAGAYRLTVRLDERYLVDRVIELRPGETLDLTIPTAGPQKP